MPKEFSRRKQKYIMAEGRERGGFLVCDGRLWGVLLWAEVSSVEFWRTAPSICVQNWGLREATLPSPQRKGY